MKHVILGWGSLLWDEGRFPLRLKSEWDSDGPSLPLEFSRVSQSRNGTLTLVVDPVIGENCQSSFAISAQKHLDDVICDLRCREGTVLRRIGFVDTVSGAQRSNVHSDLAGVLRNWAQERGVSSVVWTDLPSNFNEGGRGQFSVEAAARYLRGLDAEGARKAREYIERAPESISTPLRRHVEKSEWWFTYGVT